MTEGHTFWLMNGTCWESLYAKCQSRLRNINLV